MFTKLLNTKANTSRSFLTDDRGAVDMPSTLVTVLVLAFLAGAIVLSVFKIIPWAQDKILEHDVGTVAAAQELYATQVAAGMTTSANASHTYATADQLVTAGLLQKVPGNVTITLSGATTLTDFTDDGFKVQANSAPKSSPGGTPVSVTGGKQ